MNDEDQDIAYEPEDCEECGCSSGEFEDSDWKNGAWSCPECGAVQ